MFSIDMKEIKQFEKDLGTFSKKAVPRANMYAMNTSAFEAQRVAKKIIKGTMIQRNTWTERNFHVEKAKLNSIERQSAFFGSRVQYMETQEFGDTERKKGKHGVAIPTPFASGEASGTVKKKAIKRSYDIRNIRINKRKKKYKSTKQSNLLAIKAALKEKKKFVFLEKNNMKGIFHVAGTKKKPKVNMVYNLSHPSIEIPKNPWLEPSMKNARGKMPQIYNSEIAKQMEYYGLFK